MKSSPFAMRRPLALFILSTLGVGTCAMAQVATASGDAGGPVARLGRNIRVLAASPRDVEALLGAGQASLDLGDANAALGFFARAEDASPSNGPAKAGLGSALVMTERPDDALRLFAQAVSLGVPEAEIARDRGLAYDLRGDNRRAQRDYALAFERGRDDELVRRYALSLAISGDRQAALATIDPLLRKQDQGAWRARAFILAMTGDVPGANTVAHQLMVPAVADAMAPLLSRLATLNAMQRAHAVNFGTVPADGPQIAMATPPDAYARAVPPVLATPLPREVRPPAAVQAGAGLVPKGVPLGSRVGDATRGGSATTVRPTPRPDVGTRAVEPMLASALTPLPSPSASSPPGLSRVQSVPSRPGTAVGVGTSTRVAAIDRSRLPPEARGEASGVTILSRTALPAPDTAGALVSPVRQDEVGAPSPLLVAAPPASVAPSVTSVAVVRPAQTPTPAPTPADVGATAAVQAHDPTAGFIGPPRPDTLPPGTATAASAPLPAVPAEAAAAVPAESAAAVTPAPRAASSPTTRLAGLLDGVQREPEPVAELPSARELRAARAAAKRKLAELAAQTAKEKAVKEQVARDKAAKAEAAADARRYPARLWVQVATGRADSSLTWKRLKTDNAAALKGLSAWSAPYKSTYRLLAGPLKSPAAARDLVKALARNGVGALTYSSEAGEEIVKIDTK